MFSLKKGSLSVSDYFTEITTLWDDIASFRPLPHCSCPVQCNCLASRAGIAYRQEDYVMRFLGGLIDEFDIVCTHILVMDNFPDIDKFFSLFMQHERRISPTGSEDSTNFINAVEGKKPFGRGRGRLKICTHCGKTGHTENVCYKKYGYPYASKGKSPVSSHHILGESSNSNDDELSSEKGDSDQSFSLTSEQYQVLMTLLQQSTLASTSQNRVATLTTRTMDLSDSDDGKSHVFSIKSFFTHST
jgi:hypothetical protein